MMHRDLIHDLDAQLIEIRVLYDECSAERIKLGRMITETERQIDALRNIDKLGHGRTEVKP